MPLKAGRLMKTNLINSLSKSTTPRKSPAREADKLICRSVRNWRRDGRTSVDKELLCCAHAIPDVSRLLNFRLFVLAFPTVLCKHSNMENESTEVAKDESKAKGGNARALALTPERRKEIARQAALSRWTDTAPVAEYEGEFPLGDKTIQAVVLPDGTRLITQATFLRALGRARSPKAGKGVLSTVDRLPFFMDAEVLKPFIDKRLIMSTAPVFYRTKNGGRGVGYRAEVLPSVADVYLKYRDDLFTKGKKVSTQYDGIVRACDILLRGLARVGIIALVDEATGYQYDRARNALTQILERFIDNELQKWIKTFPDEFYQQIARLRGYQLNDINKRGSVYAQLTNYLIYRRLAPGVLRELKRINPKDAKGRRKHKYFQRLTEDIGNPALRELLSNQIVLMKIFPDGAWKEFDEAMNRAIPIYGDLPLFDAIEDKDATLRIASGS